jgi:hypothetical protein
LPDVFGIPIEFVRFALTLLGFAILSKHFEKSRIPQALPRRIRLGFSRIRSRFRRLHDLVRVFAGVALSNMFPEAKLGGLVAGSRVARGAGFMSWVRPCCSRCRAGSRTRRTRRFKDPRPAASKHPR